MSGLRVAPVGSVQEMLAKFTEWEQVANPLPLTTCFIRSLTSSGSKPYLKFDETVPEKELCPRCWGSGFIQTKHLVWMQNEKVFPPY